MTAPELSRPVRLDSVGNGCTESLEATEGERTALVARFGLESLDRLTAEWRLRAVAAGVEAEGRVRAAGAQACVTTGEPVPFTLDAPVALLFARQAEVEAEPDVEVELTDSDLDTLPIEGGPIDGGVIDVGEATAQSLALELDPYPRAPDADELRRALGIASEVEANPFAALLGLKRHGLSPPPRSGEDL